MKIRSDFVTNSSSSSFVVDLMITGTNGKDYYISSFYDMDGQSRCNAEFDREEILKMGDIKSLVDYLIASISIQNGMFSLGDYVQPISDNCMKNIGYVGEIVFDGKKFLVDDIITSIGDGVREIVEALDGEVTEVISETDYYIYAFGTKTKNYMQAENSGQIVCIDIGEFITYLKSNHEDIWEEYACDYGFEDVQDIFGIVPRMEAFKKNVVEELENINAIASIKFTKNLESWGEGSGCAIWNDKKLLEAAKNVRESEGVEKEEAIEKLKNYLKTPCKRENPITPFNVPEQFEIEKKAFVFAHLSEEEMEKIENIVTSQKGSVKKRVTDKVDYVIYNPSKLKNGWSDKEWDKEQKKCEMAKMLKEEGNSIALMSIREFMETQGILYQEKIEQSGWEEWAGEWPSGFANATWEYD